ncbi:MAG: transposase [Anaerolineales bacterium]|nr:transposase [Anaerolineales bacterium]
MPHKPPFPRRRPVRLKNYDYTAPGVYFVTLCTHRRLLYFNDPWLRDLAARTWQAIPAHALGVALDEWVIMPNHVHGLLVFEPLAGPAQSARNRALPIVIRTYKAAVTTACRQAQRAFAWQADYYEHVIRDDKDLDNTRRYSLSNPLKYTDPSGHFPVPLITGLIGAGIGAAVAGGLYYAYNRESFDWGECLVATGAGAVAGGLIGSGVGLINAGAVGASLAVASTAINVGAGAAGAGAGYIATNPESFDNTNFAVNTTAGGVIGGVSGAIPAEGAGLLAKGLVNQVGSVAQYSVSQAVNGQPITQNGIANSLIGGTVAGVFDMGASSAAAQLTSGFQPGKWVNPGNAALLATGSRRAAGVAGVGAIYFFTAGGISVGINATIPSFEIEPE